MQMQMNDGMDCSSYERERRKLKHVSTQKVFFMPAVYGNPFKYCIACTSKVNLNLIAFDFRVNTN